MPHLSTTNTTQTNVAPPPIPWENQKKNRERKKGKEKGRVNRRDCIFAIRSFLRSKLTVHSQQICEVVEDLSAGYVDIHQITQPKTSHLNHTYKAGLDKRASRSDYMDKQAE